MMNDIEHAKTLLLEGKLVAIPTETVYGLGADPKNPAAIQKIYSAKGRPKTNPLIIHLPNPDAMQQWARNIPDLAWQLAEAFWPGPLTLILKRHPDVLKLVTGGQETVALRIPNHPVTLELLNQLGRGIAAPSANRYGRISPTTTEHVREELGEAVDFILEGGPCKIGIESTIVSLIDPIPTILRQGSISALALSRASGIEPEKWMASAPTKIETPGLSASHYAPSKPLYLLETAALVKTTLQLLEKKRWVSVFSFSEKQELNNNFLDSEWIANWVVGSKNPERYANQLYHQLRGLDNSKGDYILVEMPPDTPDWLAIRDRLKRASRPVD